MTVESPMLEIASLVTEAGGLDLHACMQCGTCTAVCPWPEVEAFSPRLILRQASLGLEGWEQDLVWRCLTCRACEQRCPRAIAITEVMRAARSVLQRAGGVPRALGGPLASLRAQGNPWEGEAEKRAAWTQQLQAPLFTSDCEALLLPCCTQIHDARSRRASSALVWLLKKAGMAFGSLSEGLQCCGDQARKVGAQQLYDDLNDANQRAYRDHDVTHAWVASPHCLNVLRQQADAPTAEHYTEVLWRLVHKGRLRPVLPREGAVTYHDPCYLGRYAGVYDAPRRILTSIPGLDLREMPRHREQSLCCGAGGGGLWHELPTEQRLAVHRVREARDTGAQVLVTACPYCMLMFEDAIKALDLEHDLQVQDVAQVLAHAMGLNDEEAVG